MMALVTLVGQVHLEVCPAEKAGSFTGAVGVDARITNTVSPLPRLQGLHSSIDEKYEERGDSKERDGFRSSGGRWSSCGRGGDHHPVAQRGGELCPGTRRGLRHEGSVQDEAH